MATINGSLTIQAKSTVTAKSNQKWAGYGKIKSTSTLTAKGNVIISGATNISSSSKLSIFWLKMGAYSNVNISGAVIQRLGSVNLSGVSNFTSDLIKAAEAFLRSIFIEGEVIDSTTLEGGGSECMKINQDIELTSGDYFEINANIFDKKGNPKDVSGFTFQWTMNAIIKTIGNGITIVDGINGKIQIVLTTEDTKNFYGTYEHRVVMTDVSGHSTTVLKGLAKILK
jgi:hypothetical protein